MLKRQYHIEQPDTSYEPRPNEIYARQPIIVPPDIPPEDFVRMYPPGDGGRWLPASVLGRLERVQNRCFRTGINPATNACSLIIADMQGYHDYRLFHDSFKQDHPQATPAPGLEVIGCGYDVFSSFADSSGLKRRLFDDAKMPSLKETSVGAKKYAHWPIVSIFSLAKSSRRVIVGQTVTDYAAQFSVSAGVEASFLVFHAQVEGDYITTQDTSMYNAFSNVLDTVHTFAVHLDDRDDLRNHLHDDVRNAIDNADGKWSPDRVFDEFGLYFLTGVIVGGRLNYFTIVDTFKLNSSTDIGALAEADFLDLIGTHTDVQTSSQFAIFQRNSESDRTTIGGSAALGGGSIHDQASYQAWKDSVAELPCFCDFTAPAVKAPLTPIWHLATGNRRDELKNRAPQYVDYFVRDFKAKYPIDPTPRTVNYVVTTYTSDDRGAASTDSKIHVQLHGVDRLGRANKTPWLSHHDARNNHERGAIDAIRYEGLLDVGELNKIRIRHDGRGDAPAWLLDTIEVLCMQNGKRYRHYYGGWLDKGEYEFPLHQ